jgi:hypothetical protein
MKLLIVGLSGTTHLGKSFLTAAENLGLEAKLVDTTEAYQAPWLLRQVNWRLRGRYPAQLPRLSQAIVEECLNFQPHCLLVTGLGPVNALSLQRIGALGIQRFNFLTDDPFNPVHRAAWFLEALPHYDLILSPRRANIGDLKDFGCGRVEYLPFGYDTDLFYSPHQDQPPPGSDLPSAAHPGSGSAEVIFAGAADADRLPYMEALIDAGFQLALYGKYWDRYPRTKSHGLGQAHVATLRSAINTAKVALCLVRRANRDGHCMRTFEVPAVGGACMLTEDTPEHRELFGPEGEAVLYFNTLAEMVSKTHWLLAHDQERQRLAANAHRLVTRGGHSYQDRLKTMLTYCQS